MPARPDRHRLISSFCSSARGFVPRFLSTLSHPHAVALPFVRCGQLTGGLSPPRSCPCWAHNSTASRRSFCCRSLPRREACGASSLSTAHLPPAISLLLKSKAGRNCHLNYGTKTRRKPTRLLRPPGASLLRLADRQYLAKLNQRPPRRTRYEPVAGPTGLLTVPFALQSS